MTAWNDFNDAEEQSDFGLIPKGTVVRLRMTVKPGGYDDASQGWTGGYATQSNDTGSVYLAAEFVVLEGEFGKRKVFSNVGLYSPKGETWGQMGRSFIRAALNSARGVLPQDTGPQATAARRIQGLHELDGLEFVARIDVEKDGKGEQRNVVKYAIEPDQPEYAQAHGVAAAPRGTGAPAAFGSSKPGAAPSASAAKPGAVSGKPAWAQ